VFSRPSSRVSSVTPSPTQSTLSARPSPPSTLSTLSSARDALSTVSVVKFTRGDVVGMGFTMFLTNFFLGSVCSRWKMGCVLGNGSLLLGVLLYHTDMGYFGMVDSP
jgi:hypothetical protein